MAEHGGDPLDPHPLDAKWFISIRFIGLILIILSFCIHQFNPANKGQSKPNESRKQRFFDNIIIFICIVNILITISLITRSMCFGCRVSRFFANYFYLTAKVLGYLFFIHRAKLAQPAQSKLSKTCFETILPLIFVAVWIICMAGLTPSLLTETETCVEYKNDSHPSRSPSYCHVIVVEQEVSDILMVGLAIDILIVAFLLCLFIKPLVDSLSRLRLKKINLLKWSIAMTFINLMSSNIAIIGSSIIGEQISRYYLGLDPAINTITFILMIDGNRKLLHSIFCGVCNRMRKHMIEEVASDDQTSNKPPSKERTVPSNFVEQLQRETVIEEEQKSEPMHYDEIPILSEEKQKELFAIFQVSQCQCLRECLELGLPDDFIASLLENFQIQLYQG